MSYTNVDITRNRLYEDLDKKIILLQAEKDYIAKELEYALNELKNIPEAINEYGYVDLTYDTGKTMRLIKQEDK